MGGGKTRLADVAEHLGGISSVYYASAGERKLKQDHTNACVCMCVFHGTQAHTHMHRSHVFTAGKARAQLLFRNNSQDFGCKSRQAAATGDHIR